MKKVKSFDQLNKMFNEQYNDTSFEEFIRSDTEGKKYILSEFGIEYNASYSGMYNRNTGKIIIDGVLNPFNEKLLSATPVSNFELNTSFSMVDNQKIQGVLSSIDTNQIGVEVNPDTVFTFNITSEVVKYEKYEKAKQKIQENREREKAFQEAKIKKARELRGKKEEERQKRERQAIIIKEQEREESKLLEEKKRLASIEKRKREMELLITRRKIRNLIHFTQLDNLDSILKRGICSRQKMICEGIRTNSNDSNRFDMHTECVNVTVEYPNTWLLHEYMKRHPENRWVILVLDIKLLYGQENFYAYHNAGTKTISSNLSNMNTSEAFEKMFDDHFTVYRNSGENLSFNRAELLGLDYLTTSDQAEILVSGDIKMQYIEKIIFYNEEDMKEFQNSHNINGFEVRCNPKIFYYHRNYYPWGKR